MASRIQLAAGIVQNIAHGKHDVLTGENLTAGVQKAARRLEPERTVRCPSPAIDGIAGRNGHIALASDLALGVVARGVEQLAGHVDSHLRIAQRQ
ncbi:hypothetical protein AT302_15580 [Pandoraea norimbergensis]|uniref:Uncharacterized protein n=1 Tax=Pandoraea norimbergensis TaxID=93219 RepID=A0ABM5WKR4_9BURK|nr:hypothetical protein AT302_15580 [Pandoraea norimbergensis]